MSAFSAVGNYVWGSGAVNSDTGNDIPDWDELDLTFDYRFQESWLKGLAISLSGAFVEEQGVRSSEEYRVIVNYRF